MRSGSQTVEQSLALSNSLGAQFSMWAHIGIVGGAVELKLLE